MPMHYIDPAHEADPHALPNVEVWQDGVLVCPRCEAEHPESYALAVSGQPCISCGEEIAAEHWRRDRIDPCWFYWFCFPGCLPEGDAIGPFETEAEALADARDGMEE